MAWAARSISGKLVSNNAIALGLRWRIALMTVRPSAAPGMCRSLGSTSYRSELISFKASATLLATVMSKPSRSTRLRIMVFSNSSSSTSRILVAAIRLFSVGHSGAFTDGTILQQKHAEILEEERHILSSLHRLSVDNFWGGCDRAAEKTVLTFTNV